MSTRAQLVERVLKAANAASTNANISKARVIHELNSVLAVLLKAQVYEGFQEGDSVPHGAIIATYENVPLDRRDANRSSAKLPVTPMRLPGGIGVFSVYPSGYPEQEFIPVEPGLLYTVTKDKLISPLGPQCYTYDSGRVWFGSDAIGNGVSTVDMKLCVVDIVSMSDNDPLPIPADIETAAITSVLQVLGIATPERADNKTKAETK